MYRSPENRLAAVHRRDVSPVLKKESLGCDWTDWKQNNFNLDCECILWKAPPSGDLCSAGFVRRVEDSGKLFYAAARCLLAPSISYQPEQYWNICDVPVHIHYSKALAVVIHHPGYYRCDFAITLQDCECFGRHVDISK